MKFRVLFIFLLIGSTAPTQAQDFLSQHTSPVSVRLLSDDNGVLKEEKDMSYSPETFCFEEEFFCSMEQGRCICDVYSCNEEANQKEYWLEISGTLAQTYCLKPSLLNELTGLCLCNQNVPYCRSCTIPREPDYPVPKI